MSELTPCNYCTLRSIEARATRKGEQVTLRVEDGRTAVYVHPPGVVLAPVGEETPDARRAALFLALSEQCVC